VNIHRIALNMDGPGEDPEDIKLTETKKKIDKRNLIKSVNRILKL